MSFGGYHQTPEGRRRDREAAKATDAVLKTLFGRSSFVKKSKKKQEGCYIATAVYGSYDCPEVWVLRRFRDNSLAKSWYGRAFIHIYYAISPLLVEWFGNKAWFRYSSKHIIEKLVKKLMNNGVASTPYDDNEI